MRVSLIVCHPRAPYGTTHSKVFTAVCRRCRCAETDGQESVARLRIFEIRDTWNVVSGDSFSPPRAMTTNHCTCYCDVEQPRHSETHVILRAHVGSQSKRRRLFGIVETSSSLASDACVRWQGARRTRDTQGAMHTKSGAGPCVKCNVLTAPNHALSHYILVSTFNLKPKLKPAILHQTSISRWLERSQRNVVSLDSRRHLTRRLASPRRQDGLRLEQEISPPYLKHRTRTHASVGGPAC
ncbi:hypothetical protein EV401DRAFT_374424 [Pisolithus croceorrhizus]|nr:hypothetical protein EV401DRAFT_374424 [Pisolithus croceorrhizus]